MRDPTCSACPLGDYVRSTHGHVCIWGESVNADAIFPPAIGPGPPTFLEIESVRLFIVGQNPGKEENFIGRPFIGPSGQYLRGILKQVASNFPYALSNAVKCHTQDNEPPTNESIDACRPYLVQEILQYRPEVILALGAVALKALTGRAGIQTHRHVPADLRVSIRRPLEALGMTEHQPGVLATVHPAHVLRYPENKQLLKDDIIGAVRYCRRLSGEEVAPDATWVDA